MARLEKNKRLIWISVLAGLLFGPGAYEMVRLNITQRQLDKQLNLLALRRRQLEAEQARFKSDSAYVEGLIRSTFKVSQPGELVIPIDEPLSQPAKPFSKTP